MLLYKLAAKVTKEKTPHGDYIAQAIGSGRLGSDEQVSAATKFCSKNDPTADEKAFDAACGVGVVVSDAEISAAIAGVLDSFKDTLLAERYRALGRALGKVKSTAALQWADSGKVKSEFDAQALALLGPKDERDDPAAAKKAAKKAAPKAASAKSAESRGWEPATLESMFAEGEISRLHKVGENPQIKPELTAEHLRATGGQVITRFPPEPNGFLHIGHAKAALLNEYFARSHNGKLIVRFDDTNPNKEKAEFEESITEDLRLLGIHGDVVTHTSDHFQTIYEYALKMINKGLAYADDTPHETMKEERMNGIASQRRDQSVEENLQRFELMRQGTEEGLTWCLRAKMSVDNPNKAMRDPVIFRCNLTPHHRTGTLWKIYPTYDFCCPIVDSIEGVTHALRSMEYRDRNP
ncbi:glutamate--tRNA ligase, partial [Coemansia sp. RSA 1937]